MTLQEDEADLINDIYEDISRLIDYYIPSTLGLNDLARENIENKVHWFVSEDLEVLSKKDPASKGRTQYIRDNYKTFKAIMFYRLANELYYFENLDKMLREGLARGISEEAKVITRIEIHPAAKIGRRFVIDHGVGTLIGETCEIGDDCYLLQGVTLGARKKAYNNPGKRHPSIGNWVEIGAFARIFGPVKIGDNVEINSHCVIKEDIPDNQNVMIINQLQLSTSRLLFNWNSILETDNIQFLKFLKDDLNIDAENAKITKTVDNKTIHVYMENISVELTLVSNKNAKLIISDGRTCDLRVKEENGGINLYKYAKPNKIEVYGIVPEKDGIISIYGHNLEKTSVLFLDKHFHNDEHVKSTIISNNNNHIQIKLVPEMRIEEREIKELKKVKIKIMKDDESIIITGSIGWVRAIESLKYNTGS